jgi:glucose/arabinose dehydrogenase
MKRRLTKSLIATALGTGLALTGGLAVGAGATTTAWQVTPVLSGLNGPRGLAFDNGGNLIVAEAGQFQPVSGMNFAVSQTGKVDKFRLDGGTATLKWSTSFNSLSDSFLGGGPEVLGPAGVATDGNHVLALISENSTGVHKLDPALSIPQVGHLFSLNPGTGQATDLGDIGDQEYAWAGQHASLWKEFPDANPNAVLVIKGGHDRTFVVDAGANTVGEVMPNGQIRVIAYIPNDPVRDSTPTCITQGPDGALYVGTLDLVANLFVFGPGQSHVYRIDPNTHESFLTAAHVWASGLTTVFGCAFDRNGNFWATEMFQPNSAGPPGDVVRIPFHDPSAVEHIGLGSVPTPGGIAEGPDGAMYVATGAPNATPGSGGVVKITAG